MLEKSLSALLRQDYPRSRLELLLLDDGSSDDTYGVMKRFEGEFKKAGFADFRAFRHETNRGLISGRNYLASKISATSGAMLVLDDDVYVEQDSLSLLAGYFVSLSGCAVLGPRVVFEAAREKTAASANFINRLTGVYRMAEPARPTECDWLSSSCILVDPAVWKEAGGFCEAFYTCHEEPDFCLRVKKAGFKIVYYPQVRVRHDINLEMQRRAKLYYLYRNKLWLIRRNFSFPGKLTALLLVLILGLPKYILESLLHNKESDHSELRAILKAVKDGLFMDWR
jgi:hypothetical protein